MVSNQFHQLLHFGFKPSSISSSILTKMEELMEDLPSAPPFLKPSSMELLHFCQTIFHQLLHFFENHLPSAPPFWFQTIFHQLQKSMFGFKPSDPRWFDKNGGADGRWFDKNGGAPPFLKKMEELMEDGLTKMEELMEDGLKPSSISSSIFVKNLPSAPPRFCQTIFQELLHLV